MGGRLEWTHIFLREMGSVISYDDVWRSVRTIWRRRKATSAQAIVFARRHWKPSIWRWMFLNASKPRDARPEMTSAWTFIARIRWSSATESLSRVVSLVRSRAGATCCMDVCLTQPNHGARVSTLRHPWSTGSMASWFHAPKSKAAMTLGAY